MHTIPLAIGNNIEYRVRMATSPKRVTSISISDVAMEAIEEAATRLRTTRSAVIDRLGSLLASNGTMDSAAESVGDEAAEAGRAAAREIALETGRTAQAAEEAAQRAEAEAVADLRDRAERILLAAIRGNAEILAGVAFREFRATPDGLVSGGVSGAEVNLLALRAVQLAIALDSATRTARVNSASKGLRDAGFGLPEGGAP